MLHCPQGGATGSPHLMPFLGKTVSRLWALRARQAEKQARLGEIWTGSLNGLI